MSIKTQKVLSPTKQNMSPTRHASKGVDTIAQLIGFIKAAGLRLPSHIQKCLNPEQAPLLKIKSGDQQNGKQEQNIQKLKVKLGDAQFELKKLEQDFAQFKLTARIQKEKQIKKWEQSYNQLKSSLEFSNQDSSIKLLKLRQLTDKQIKALNQKHKAEIIHQKQTITKNYEQKLASKKKLHERQIKQINEKLTTQICQLKQKHELQIKTLKQNYEAQIKKNGLKYKENLDAKQKQFDSVCVALQCQKKTQQKLHEKTRIQSSQAKQKLYSQLYYQRNLKKDLQQIVSQRQSQIKSLKITIRELQTEIVLQKQKSQKRQKQLQRQWQKQKIGVQQLNKQKIAQIILSHDKELKKLQNSIQQLSEWRQNKEELLNERCEQIQSKFDERPSRSQDLQAIQKYRSKLLRKQQEVRLLNKQLKNCVMESQNKEETYNKIFTTNTLNKFEKKMLSKDRQQFKSKDSLCRKSQTTDIKFLLKVYNKHL